MTFVNDFIDGDQSLDDDYPTAFGITFTPIVSCIALSILGIVGTGYIYMNMVVPAQQATNKLETQKQEKQAQFNKVKQEGYDQKVANFKEQISEQKVLKSKVISMFTNQDDLETLLIDINSFITANQGELIKYTPDHTIATINDSSLGAAVQGKLKKKGLDLEIKGTFSQTQAILQDIERLEPLLIIKSYKSKVTQEPKGILVSNRDQIVEQEAAILTTKLKIDAILPLSQKELQQARKAEAKAKKQQSQTKQRSRKSRKN
ncbi:MAG: type II and III secretion system protein [Xenococcus sp. MO_188.B8]|nr:type II and III secretion system protein [Xenococcus sp. MO_188.B8]